MPTNSTTTIWVLFALVLAFMALTAFFRAFVRSRRGLPLRPMPGYQAVPRLQGRAIETGQSLHISLGTGGVGGADTAATLSGLAILDTIAEEAVASDSPPTITVADPTAMILAQDVLRRAYTRQHNAAGYDPRAVRFVAAPPMAYGAGVMDMLAHEETAASIIIGAIGPEAALLVEEGARQGITQIVGTSDAMATSLLYPSADHLLVGEEMFVPGAYVGTDAGRISSLIVQDIFRWLIVAAILLGAAGKLFGIWG